jgi:hypothetical protein
VLFPPVIQVYSGAECREGIRRAVLTRVLLILLVLASVVSSANDSEHSLRSEDQPCRMIHPPRSILVTSSTCRSIVDHLWICQQQHEPLAPLDYPKHRLETLLSNCRTELMTYSYPLQNSLGIHTRQGEERRSRSGEYDGTRSHSSSRNSG